ncbi:restriction endonuclease [Pedobacter psychroterrae]|uniref:NACHT domain-containing protein n=1 Tax=Pedobacter psychroterrae TaxID=2530453 RepID=A0A4R0NIB8_9SPHI|nr:restriction endonuclease [Pedobacter psychroterrae]TCC99968.1 NACHT domain-containing protein [Pedobacter psychroterrae]
MEFFNEQNTSLENGNLFEKHVRQLLVLQGRNVLPEMMIGSKKVDLSFNLSGFNKTEHYAVECKAWKSKLSKEDLSGIVFQYGGLIATNLIDSLLIVTLNGLSPAAMQLVEEHRNIKHITYVDLLNLTIDFSQFIHQQENDFYQSTDGLDQYYIDLRVRENTVTSRNTRDLMSIVEEWIASSDYTPLAILGSYGQGKSSFSRKLAAFLAKAHQSDPVKRIPIYIKLSAISKEQSIEGLLGKIFTASVNVKHYNYFSFNQLNAMGKFVIILDGFDEMKQSLNWEEFKYNFSQLNKLVHGTGKVILLGRPNAFLTDDEHAFVLRGERKSSFGIVRERDWPVYHELELELLNAPQIEKFFQDYYTYRIKVASDTQDASALAHARDYKSRHITDRKIREISNRPVQLKMLADLLPYVTFTAENLTTALLYDEFISMILDREFEKESNFNISKDNRRKFSRLIALFLWENSSEYSIKFEEIPNNIFEQFIPENARDIDKIKRDFISGCFLSRKLGSTIYFPHRSFQEYFVAEEVVIQITSGQDIDIKKIDNLLTVEVSDFVKGLAGLKIVVNLDLAFKNYRGMLSTNLVRIFFKPEYKRIFLQQVLTSYAPWYKIIFVLMHEADPFTAEQIGEFKQFLIRETKKLTDDMAAVCALFLAMHEKINTVETILSHLCEELIIYYNKILKEARKKQIHPVAESVTWITDLLLKTNISTRNNTLDLRALLPLFVKKMEGWCFITEWKDDKTLNSNEYRIVSVLRDVDDEVIGRLRTLKLVYDDFQETRKQKRKGSLN